MTDEELDELAARAWPRAAADMRPRLVELLRSVLSFGGTDPERVHVGVVAALRVLAGDL